jgi:phage terminase small subunit
MTQPKKLTDQQRKFAELYVYNEGRMSPAEAAYAAGYKTRSRQVAAEMQSRSSGEVWNYFRKACYRIG